MGRGPRCLFPWTHGTPGSSSGAGTPLSVPQTHTDPKQLQPRPAGPAPALVPRPPCCCPGCGMGSRLSSGPILLPLLLGDGLMAHQAGGPRPCRRRGFWPLGTAGRVEKACLHMPAPPSPPDCPERSGSMSGAHGHWAGAVTGPVLTPPAGVLGVRSPLHRRGARASSRWLRAGALGQDLGHGSRPAVGTLPTQALHGMDDLAGAPGTGSQHTRSSAPRDAPAPWRGSCAPWAAPPQPLRSSLSSSVVVAASPLKPGRTHPRRAD